MRLTRLVTFILSTSISFTNPSLLYAHNVDKNTTRDVQLMLALKGIHKGEVDGIKGPVTKSAIEEYQRIHNMVITGEVSDPLREKLYEELFLKSRTSNQTDKSEGEELIPEAIRSLAEELRRTKSSLQNTNVTLNGHKRSIQELRGKKPQALLDWLDVLGIGSTFAIGILAIVLALMSLAGYQVYKTVESKLTIKYDNLLRNGSIKIRVLVYTNLSRAFYLYYRSFFSRSDYLTHPGFRSGVELALMFCEHSLVVAGEWGDEVAEKHDTLMTVKAHRAYHQASRRSADDIRAALSVVEQLKKYANQLLDRKDLDRWAEITETIAWILIRRPQEGGERQSYR